MTPTSILVVDDETIIAKGIEKRLKGLGYAVVGLAATGEEAVARAAESRPDLVLMDINLGAGMDGVEAAARIRAAGVPVVFLTAFSDADTLQRAKLTGPLGYVLKPYTDPSLQTAIEIGVYRHAMDRRLREHEQWLAATLASIGDGLIATDARGRVTFLNAPAERLTGWAQAAARGRDVRDVFRVVGEGTREPVANPAVAALERGEPVELAPDTLLVDAGGGERPIRDAGGEVTGAVLVFRDVTERRRLDAYRKQAQTMEAVGRLAGGIAHDFNNIMTIIVGFSELLLGDPAASAEQRGAARHIREAGGRAAALTRQILAFGRKQILVPRELDLNAVVRDMGAQVQRLVGAHVEVVADPAPGLGKVKADPGQIGQLLLDLAANARHAMPLGGRLVVRTANAELGEAVARAHPDVKPGAYVLLAVADTGREIPADELPHVFEPFFTTKEFGQGGDLGLAAVHGVVKQSGGHAEVTSTVGVGTEFRVYLPRVEPLAPPAGTDTRPAAHETVLLVEGEELVRTFVKTILTQRGYTVLEAPDGLKAVRVATDHPGPIHLLLADPVTPYSSGREVAARLMPGRPGLRVLFMSGSAEDVSPHEEGPANAVAVLPKPFTAAALTSAVRAALDRA